MADNKNQEQVAPKTITDDVIDAITAAANGLKGDEMSFADALTKAGKEDNFFNPTLSQYREGMVLNTDPSVCKIKKVPVGTQGNQAWVVICPVGHLEGEKVVYDAAFNFYPSTLRKNIQRTSEEGEPVIDENNKPIETNADNAVYEAARACSGPKELLEYAMGKVFVVDKIKRDFGPAGFVDRNGVRKPTMRKLTSAPVFRIIG